MKIRLQSIALEAFRRGFISDEIFASAILTLADGYHDDVWLERGWLDEAQLAECISIVDHGAVDESSLVESEAVRDLHDPELMERAKTSLFGRDVVAQVTQIEDTVSTVALEESSIETHHDFPSLETETEFYITGSNNAGNAARYVVGAELGSGGGGRVVRAFDRLLGRTVAMKILATEHADAHYLQRFLLEAKTTGQLEHPNIVPIYDVGKLASGELYYTMQEIRRNSLRDALLKLRAGDGEAIMEFPLVRLMAIVSQLCDAVAYAHSRGVIHRDIKPDNIMLGDFGEVLLTDWGLAHSAMQREVHTDDPHTLGTPAYMPPEQARGELHRVDERSDIYAMGAVLYEVLTLEQPFVGDGPVEIMMQVVDAPLISPRERVGRSSRAIPTALNDIAVRAMEKDPAMRFVSAKEMRDALDEWMQGIQARESQRKAKDGQRAARMYDAFDEQVLKLTEQVKRQSSSVEPWEPIENKREVWRLEDELARAQVERARAYGEAVSHYLQSLAHAPDDRIARRGLADLYWKRRQMARDLRDEADAVYYETLALQYDDGHYASLLGAAASIQISTEPADADITIAKVSPQDRVWVAGEETTLGASPAETRQAESGSYVVRALREGKVPVLAPVVLQRGRLVDVAIRLPDQDECLDGFAFVSGGEFVQGGDLAAFDPRPSRRVSVSDFFCAQYPVTFREYLEMIDALFLIDPDLAIERAPQTRGAEGLLVRRDGENWVPHEILIEGPAREMYPLGEGHEWNLPVVGIRHEDAIAYCEWRGAQIGVNLRLPSEDEWEKAARGVDGRIFSWGDQFDATFCKMRFSRADLPQLEPVGTFPHDCSPYGIFDTSGGVQEWCAGRGGNQVEKPIRGGAWNQDHRASRLAGRVEVLAAARTAGIGFRTVYSGKGSV